MGNADSNTTEAPTFTRADLNILRYLAKRPNDWVNAYSIPDGNGHTSSGGANGKRLSALTQSGFIRYGKEPQHSLRGYQITQRGMLYV